MARESPLPQICFSLFNFCFVIYKKSWLLFFSFQRKTAAMRGVLAGHSQSMECGSLSQTQFAQWNARQHCYGKGCIVVLGDLANRQSGTEAEQAVGRSALRMLHSVGRVPMVPEREFVWRSQSSNCVRIRTLSFCLSFCLTYSFISLLPLLSSRLKNIHGTCVCMCLPVCSCMSMHHVYPCVYGAFF